MVNNKTIFLTKYLVSLTERTRSEKRGRKTGLDWVIYNLGIQKGWTPHRLPFHRSSYDKEVKSKTEAEFGIDISFINESCNELIIFVLKDEPLKNDTWNKNNFDSDLRMASKPDITNLNVSSIKIILAYNKDEDRNGIILFENFVKNTPDIVENKKNISFERWNLSKIVSEVETDLFNPDLLPQHLSGVFSYLCSQVGDFKYASDEWVNQLIPNWKRFLKLLFEEKIEEKRIALIPVILFIIKDFQKDTAESKIGWLELIEIAMLYLWANFRTIENTDLKNQIILIWYTLYITELELYISKNEIALTTEHGIHSQKFQVGNLAALNDSVLIFDIIGKIGILTSQLNALIDLVENQVKVELSKKIYHYSELIIKCLKSNPAIFRPLIDLHHIQLYFIWIILYQTKKYDEIIDWFYGQETYLMIRRIGNSTVPFIEGRNRLDLVAEYAATNEKPYEFIDDASCLIEMLLELTFSIEETERKKIQTKLFKHIVLGLGDDDKNILKVEEIIDLQSWEPPEDWDQRIFLENVTDGISISTNNFNVDINNIDDIESQLKTFVNNVVKKFPSKIRFDIPMSVYFLACIKNNSPLPPIFWRSTVFPEFYKDLEKKPQN
ncbi:MAG: hypothetical protein K8I03_01390 [Ignavibacteria bacterium]|nr:hypothetical protein [Ignavibacteria bacterium]